MLLCASTSTSPGGSWWEPGGKPTLSLLDIKDSYCFVLNLTCKSNRAILTEIDKELEVLGPSLHEAVSIYVNITSCCSVPSPAPYVSRNSEIEKKVDILVFTSYLKVKL